MKLVEDKPKPTLRKVAWIVFCISLSIRLILAALELFAGLSVLGTVTLDLLNGFVLAAAFFSIRKRRIWLYASVGLLFAVNAVFLVIHNDGAEYYFTSPQKTNTLVVSEKSALVSAGWANLYQRVYGVFKRPLSHQVGTDDNYQPFAHGQYSIEWLSESVVSIAYYNGHGYQDLEVAFPG